MIDFITILKYGMSVNGEEGGWKEFEPGKINN